MANTGLFLNPTAPQRPRTVLVLLSDGQLLERFTDRRDQQAFATLVQRHGPLVRGVCLRVLQNPDDADDAFQATFLVLSRKAAAIKHFGSLSSWLYKVAYRIALRARASKARRQAQEQQATPAHPTLPSGDIAQREMDQLLDAEVQALPEKYREPIVLCYLQGKTNEQAAAELGWPLGTVKIRLARGREALRRRLLRRGLGWSAMGVFFAVLENQAQAAVSNDLASATTQAALAQRPGGVAAGQADRALKSMCRTKLKIAAAVLLTLGLTCLADGLSKKASAAPVEMKTPTIAPVEPYAIPASQQVAFRQDQPSRR